MNMNSEALFRTLSFSKGDIKEYSLFDCFQNDFIGEIGVQV